MLWTCLVFVIVYVGMALGGLPGLKLDRAGIALLGAIALLAMETISQQTAWNSIDFNTLGLLFGLMILSAQFSLSGLYQSLAHRLVGAKTGPVGLLGLLVLVSGMLGALLTNDVIALAMAPVLIQICRERRLNPVPFLLGLACSTNAGSSATLMGSPQNILIGETLKLSFLRFLYDAGIPSILSLGVIWVVIAWMYRDKWELKNGSAQLPTQSVQHDSWETTKGLLIAGGIVVLFLVTSWPRDLIALTGGGLLLINARFQSRKMLDFEDWQLLVLFMGLFVVNAAFQETHLMDGWAKDLQAMGINLRSPVWLFVITAVLSDAVSNVPSVMLLLPYASDPIAGPTIALASGLSSNLIVIGSLANIIVIDTAARQGLKISFGEHARVGIPVTLISLAFAAGWLWLRSHGVL